MDSAVDRLLTLKVKDVMTRNVVCVSMDISLAEAAAIFVEKKISGAPVVDQQNRCVGILSATDYVKHERFMPDADAAATDQQAVRDQMSKGVQSVRPEQTLLTAARMMCVRHVHRLPVLDADGQPVGLITSMDVVAAMVNAFDERDAAAM